MSSATAGWFPSWRADIGSTGSPKVSGPTFKRCKENDRQKVSDVCPVLPVLPRGAQQPDLPAIACHRLSVGRRDSRVCDCRSVVVAVAAVSHLRLWVWLGWPCLLREECSHHIQLPRLQLLGVLGNDQRYFLGTSEILRFALTGCAARA